MKTWYPPWVKKWEESAVPKWTVEERHLWMSEALKFRRKIQAVNYGKGELDHYSALLSEFFEHFNIDEDTSGSYILEILSDGLGDVEPIWHGIRIGQDDGVQDIPTWMHGELIAKVGEYRNRHEEKLAFKTHLQIGKRLLEPSLFKVTKQKVQYYSKECWRDLDNVESPLPLKLALNKDVNVNWEDIESIRQFLPTLIQEPGYKEMIESIRESLWYLSHDVLWPGLFPNKSSHGEFLSLVLIQASTWQVPGVWALHAFSPTGKVSDKTCPKANLILSAITPPVLCLNDALGAMFVRDSSHEQRRNDLLLYRRCKGITQPPAEHEFYNIEADDRAIYNRDMSADPFTRYGFIYEAACEKYMSRRQPKHLEDAPLMLLDRVLRQSFVAMAVETQEPRVAVFILQDTVRICLKLIDEADRAHSKDVPPPLPAKLRNFPVAISAGQWLEHLIQVPHYEDWSRQRRSAILKLLAATFLSVALQRDGGLSEETRYWLEWCGHGFRSLVMSDADPEPWLTRDAFMEWEALKVGGDLEQTELWQAFVRAGVDREAIWFMTQLITRGEEV